MRMKQTSVLYIIFITSILIFLSSCNTQSDEPDNLITNQNHRQVVRASNDLEFYSTDVYDAKSMDINGQNYTILLNNDAIYSIDETGTIVNKLSHNLMEYENVKKKNSWATVHLEVIEDIDEKGMPDLLLILEDGLMNDIKSVIAISYEEGSVIWDYQPIIKTKDCNTGGKTCIESIEITHYEIKNNLYLSAGYAFQVIDYHTGDLINEVKGNNNIWDFEFSQDLNDDGIKEVVLATQPNYISILDGKTFGMINEIKINTIMVVGSYIEIEQNIWDIEFIASRNRLIAASESGITYEISLEEEEVKTNYQIFDTTTRSYKQQYMKLIQYEYSKYEQEMTDRRIRISFGRKAGFYKNVKLQEILSIDEDEHNDYIVSYDPVLYSSDRNKTGVNKSFVTVSSLSGKLESNSNDVLYSASQNYYYAYKKDGNPNRVIFQNIKTNQNLSKLIASNVSSNREDDMISKVFYLDHGQFIILTRELEIISLIDYTPLGDGIDVEFKFYSKRIRQDTQILDDYLVINDYDLEAEISKVKILNQRFDEVYHYQPKSPYKLFDLTIENDLLYLMEFNKFEADYRVSIINLKTKQIIKRVEVYKEQSFINLYFYDDVTGDGILELAVRNFQYIETVLHHSLEVFDLMNDTVIFDYTKSHEKPERGFHTESSVTILKDLNSDGLRDLIFRVERPSDGLTESTLFVSNQEDTLYDDAQIVPNDTFNNRCTYDFNSNGSKDSLVTNSEGLPSIYDYELNDYVELEYELTYRQAVVKSCDFDFNQDGVNDFVTVEMTGLTKLSNDELSDYKIGLNLKVNTLINNKLKTIFNHEFIYINDFRTLNQLYSSSLMDQFATFTFNETTNNYNIAMFKYDENHNIILEQYDLAGYKTEKRVSNPYSRTLEDGTFRYGKNLTTVTFQGKTYYHATINETGVSKHYFINIKDFTIDYVIYGDQIEIYSDYVILTNTVERLNNPFLIYDEFTNVLITKPFSANDIEVNKTGVLANQFNVIINRDDIVRIRHYYEKNAFNEYYDPSLHFVLPPGKHILKLEIKTDSGDLFYFNEIIHVKSNHTYIIGTMILLVLLGCSIYYICVHLIRKHYFKK
ncbi:hypothetical protein [Haloplasma contractile]|uniref:Membrane lipoprotein n=1 Tax=Haloplasma contractile SSD-17B TaxID=1033810 RepID=F7Q1C7_9MOLU|nr:hypothetical protein [Haloplasma contractile]ERJ12846.1 membrane lipoprotein [Haloplasma contractile SSD-17B]